MTDAQPISTGALPFGDAGPVTLNGVSFDVYEGLLGLLGDDHPSLRLTYREGTLEIMTTSLTHELVKKVIARLLEMWAFVVDINIVGYGGATFRKRAKERGLELDECYALGPMKDVPDLAIEVVHRHGGIDKLDVYAGLEIPEVWFWEDGALGVYVLDGSAYARAESSRVLPSLDVGELSRFVARAIAEGPEQHTVVVRAWRDSVAASVGD